MNGSSEGDAGSNELEVGPSVFISYRRRDTLDLAAELSQRLRTDLGASSVFRDEDDVIAGQRWNEVLRDSMNDSDAALVLVGDDWVGPRDDGTRRIDDVDDPVHQEILLALDPNINASPIPVLVDREDPPDDMPDELEEVFSSYHYVSLNRADFPHGEGSGYQHVLVGIWESLRRNTENGVLIIGDRLAMAALDKLVQELKHSGELDARDLSRFAAGAYIGSRRRMLKEGDRWPDVIVLLDEEPGSELRARLNALKAHPAILVSLLGNAAAAGMLVVETGGASVGTAVFNQSSTTAEMLSGFGQSGTASASGSGTTASGLSGVGAKAAIAGLATIATAGAAFGIVSQLDEAEGAAFAAAELAPVTNDNANAFPVGEPDPIDVDFDQGEPATDEEAERLFGNFPGGTAEWRSVEVSHGGSTVDLGRVLVPITYPGDFLERNVGTFRLTSAATDSEVNFVEAGTGAFAPCVYDGTGDTVGGWTYTGDPGIVSIELLFESDGSTVTQVGMRVSFEGPADVVFFQDVVDEVIPDDVNINDRCTPLDRSETSWASGVANSG